MDLLGKLEENSELNRLNAIDAAYLGSPYAGTNFRAKWVGYNDDGFAVVKYENQFYSAKNLSARAAVQGSNVMLRVAKGLRTVIY